MSFFIPAAMANTGASPEASSLPLYVMIVVFIVIFYFFILRPQQKRAKAHNQLMSSIGKGDEVLTSGGLIVRVVKVSDNGYLTVELNDTTEVVIKRDFVTAVLPKGTLKSL